MASGDSSDRVDPAAALPDVILPFRKPGTGLDKESDETLSLQEREILSRIHDLQRRLAKHNEEETKRAPAVAARSRLLVVSNRLPVTVRRDDESGEWTFAVSSGGLVSALARTRSQLPFIWVGWLGEEVPEADQPQISKRLKDKYNCVPVFLPQKMAEQYYNGFSNDIVWPLFHYFPLPVGKHAQHFDHDLWEAYKAANRLFSETVIDLHEKGDMVWVQDYHLMVLPAFLRARLHKARIGWFLHTPFPSTEVYRMLPVREEILRSLLACDVVGFHTYDYARHFLSSCSRLLRASIRPSGCELRGRFTNCVVAPIGIDPEYFQGIAKKPETLKRLAELRAEFAGKRVLLGVDRLDYIKGLPHKLLAMEGLLQHYGRWRGDVVFIQIGVPTRSKVHLYQRLSRKVNELVGRVNGMYGTLDYAPIRYINRSVTPTELVALYMIADVCVVSSIRDGMNLVSHEFVACQDEESPGVLVLSEFAGSAQCLSGAIRVNPWATDDLAGAMNAALQLSKKDRKLRHRQLYHYVSKTNTASMWATSFVKAMRTASSTMSRPGYLRPPNFAAYFRRSARRLIVVACDGLIARSAPIAQTATPERKMRSIVRCLAADPRNLLVIISCRERRVLEQWFGGVRAVLIAENGLLVRIPTTADPSGRDSPLPGTTTGAASAAATAGGDGSAAHDELPSAMASTPRSFMATPPSFFADPTPGAGGSAAAPTITPTAGVGAGVSVGSGGGGGGGGSSPMSLGFLSSAGGTLGDLQRQQSNTSQSSAAGGVATFGARVRVGGSGISAAGSGQWPVPGPGLGAGASAGGDASSLSAQMYAPSVPGEWFAITPAAAGGAPIPAAMHPEQPGLGASSHVGEGPGAGAGAEALPDDTLQAPEQLLRTVLRHNHGPALQGGPGGAGVAAAAYGAPATRDTWMTVVRSIFWHFTEVTPGSVVEVRDNSIAWCYGVADPELASWQAREMQASTLASALGDLPLDIVADTRVVEVRVAGASVVRAVKLALRCLASQDPVDSVFCIGNSRVVFDPLFELLVPKTAAADRAAEDNAHLSAQLGITLGSRKVTHQLIRSSEEAIPGIAAGAKIFTAYVGRQTSQAQFNLDIAAAKTLLATFASMTAGAQTTDDVSDASITHRPSGLHGSGGFGTTGVPGGGVAASTSATGLSTAGMPHVHRG